MSRDFRFLTREQIDEIHRRQLAAHGGSDGLQNEHGLESAIAQPMHVHYYGNGDEFECAAAYAFHIAESQAFIDGNKRTAVHAAVVFLELNGVDTAALPEQQTYDAMIAIANHELDRQGFAAFLRAQLDRA